MSPTRHCGKIMATVVNKGYSQRQKWCHSPHIHYTQFTHKCRKSMDIYGDLRKNRENGIITQVLVMYGFGGL